MAADGRKNIALRADAWQQRADREYEKQPALAFSGRHYQHLGHHEVYFTITFALSVLF